MPDLQKLYPMGLGSARLTPTARLPCVVIPKLKVVLHRDSLEETQSVFTPRKNPDWYQEIRCDISSLGNWQALEAY